MEETENQVLQEACLRNFNQKMLRLHNKYRKSYRLGALNLDPLLCFSAQCHTDHLAKAQLFEYSYFSDCDECRDYEENIYVMFDADYGSYVTADQVFNSWVNCPLRNSDQHLNVCSHISDSSRSPTHNLDIITNPNCESVGFGFKRIPMIEDNKKWMFAIVGRYARCSKTERIYKINIDFLELHNKVRIQNQLSKLFIGNDLALQAQEEAEAMLLLLKPTELNIIKPTLTSKENETIFATSTLNDSCVHPNEVLNSWLKENVTDEVASQFCKPVLNPQSSVVGFGKSMMQFRKDNLVNRLYVCIAKYAFYDEINFNQSTGTEKSDVSFTASILTENIEYPRSVDLSAIFEHLDHAVDLVDLEDVTLEQISNGSTSFSPVPVKHDNLMFRSNSLKVVDLSLTGCANVTEDKQLKDHDGCECKCSLL